MDNSSDVIDTVSGNGGGDSRNDAAASTSSDASSPIAITCGYRLFDRQDSLHQLMGGGKDTSLLTRTPNSWQKIAKVVGGVKLAEEVKDVADDLAFRNCCGVIGGFCEGVYRASGLLILSGVLADLAGKDE
ncbi:hypothetical protein POTOM_059220 [Populus tomentosa]|uniref:Uncharacterized protein n=1 Tax=Populus tomentosa TaxID=118781 RepID=A0A8X8C1D7_POPTO|nr:hypothetical protein POTOM_059220 [Populus tomentosa]